MVQGTEPDMQAQALGMEPDMRALVPDTVPGKQDQLPGMQVLEPDMQALAPGTVLGKLPDMVQGTEPGILTGICPCIVLGPLYMKA